MSYERPEPERLPLPAATGRVSLIEAYRRLYGLTLAEATEAIDRIGEQAAAEHVARQREREADGE